MESTGRGALWDLLTTEKEANWYGSSTTGHAKILQGMI